MARGRTAATSIRHPIVTSAEFVPRELHRESPEVHVAGMCIDATSKGIRLLLATRAPTRKLFPNLIEGCGGQLRASETFAEGVARHFRLEMGVDVNVLEDFHCFYAIREPNQPTIPGIRFLCELVRGEPRSPNHSEVKWVTEAEFRKMPAERFVGELKREVLGLVERFKRERRGRSAR